MENKNGYSFGDEIRKILYEPDIVETDFYSIADMRVAMLDKPKYPYKTMVNMATKAWGNKSNKWEDISPKTRFEIVKMILQKKALPLALEHPTFSFSVDRISRAAFDQIARARIGIVFASKGQKDDNLHGMGFVIPTPILFDRMKLIKVQSLCIEAKKLYADFIENGIPNWAARCVLPIYAEHSFIFSANFSAIQNLLSKRFETTEMEDVVAFSLLMRKAIYREFPLLAEYLRPSCDFIKRDMTASYNGFSDYIGVPHISDGRQAGYDGERWPAKWDEPCTDITRVIVMTKAALPDQWNDNIQWDDLEETDKEQFNKD